ncbi:hypothetical protein A8709_13510 [Paenibacillus pectinilyticus]|uniref:HTH araC/xylS-type domain-containing protein n=1 Tax=Paenibacillus pectinilyticus TaxID=512399 RepID=A0A1C1A3I6_9BACL|nr:helix-turn-helix domain-containing protein [Paenibacillus pectinilyticus]OCT15122.1 hypothetical protein A8709_13510 [Paenibacillus pectinilyticus]
MRIYAKNVFQDGLEFHYAAYRSIKDMTGLHDHDFYEVFLTFGGDVYHLVNNQKIMMPSNTLVFIRPNDYHAYERIEQGDCQIMNVAFPAQLMASLQTYLGHSRVIDQLLHAPLPPSTTLTLSETHQLLDRFQQLTWSALMNERSHEAGILFKMMITEVLLKFIPFMEGGREENLPAWLEHLKNQMSKKEHFTVGIADMYLLTDKSPEHISRSIKKYFGCTPTDWINHFRLRHGANLLVSTDMQIIEVAMESGFENLSHFYHRFKKMFYLSPARYRKANRRDVIPSLPAK